MQDRRYVAWSTQNQNPQYNKTFFEEVIIEESEHRDKPNLFSVESAVVQYDATEVQFLAMHMKKFSECMTVNLCLFNNIYTITG